MLARLYFINQTAIVLLSKSLSCQHNFRMFLSMNNRLNIFAGVLNAHRAVMRKVQLEPLNILSRVSSLSTDNCFPLTCE